jgi:molybdopterin-guanine dinucleotide biosynthesis protein MobB
MKGRVPPIISVIGRKNSGKTTLVVALAAELKRRGLRVASLKHSHHDFELDAPGKDSWRHFHEGEVEAVLLTSPARTALIMRTERADRDPAALIEQFLSDGAYDLVLVEAFKRAALPKIEIFRTAVHAEPLYDASDDASLRYLAIATDAPHTVAAPFPVVPLNGTNGAHVARLADLIEAQLGRTAAAG